MLFQHYLASVNWLAVIVSAIAYFALGAVWYARPVFGTAWAEGHKLTINKEDAQKQMPVLFITTLLLNIMMAFGLGFLVMVMGSGTVLSGLKLGLFCGIVFSFGAMTINNAYLGRSFKIMLIDSGYHVVGLGICGIILSVWR